MTELTIEAEMALAIFTAYLQLEDNYPQALSELVNAGIVDEDAEDLTPTGRKLLDQKQIIIIDATDAKVHAIEDTHLDNIKRRNEDIGAWVLKAVRSGEIGYVKL